MSKRAAALVVSLVGLLLGAVYFASPYYVLHQIRDAARAGESDRLARYVHLPAVRESIKAQLQEMMRKKMQGDDTKPNAFAALGMMIAGGMVDMFVDGLVTPASLAYMIDRGTPKPAGATPPHDDNTNREAAKPLRIERHYQGMNVFKVDMHDPQTDSPTLTLVLNRQSLFGWKLTAIRFAAITSE